MPKGGPVHIDARELEKLQSSLKRAEKELPKDMDLGMRDVAQLVVKLGRRNFAWSSRIPRTVKLKKLRENQYTVTAGGPEAPHTRPYDPASGRQTRHPVFATGPRAKWRWVKNQKRPGLHLAFQQAMKQADQLVGDAADKTLRRVK